MLITSLIVCVLFWNPAPEPDETLYQTTEQKARDRCERACGGG